MQLRFEIVGVVADEEAAIVNGVGVDDLAHAVVVEVLDDVVAQEILLDDRAENPDAGLDELLPGWSFALELEQVEERTILAQDRKRRAGSGGQIQAGGLL